MKRDAMTAEEFRKRFGGGPAPKTRHKYNATAVTVDGLVFASQREADRYGELVLLKRAKRIAALVLQPRFELQPAFTHRGRKERPIAYVADFAYVERPSGVMVVEDVKGLRTDVYRLKRKLFLHKYPHIDFREIA